MSLLQEPIELIEKLEAKLLLDVVIFKFKFKFTPAVFTELLNDNRFRYAPNHRYAVIQNNRDLKRLPWHHH